MDPLRGGESDWLVATLGVVARDLSDGVVRVWVPWEVVSVTGWTPCSKWLLVN